MIADCLVSISRRDRFGGLLSVDNEIIPGDYPGIILIPET